MIVSPTIFREYDIRGIAAAKFEEKIVEEYEKWYGKFPGVTITKEISQAIGRAYGTIIRRDGGRNIVIGHEVRPGAEDLKKAFIDGARETGCGIWDLGISLTPVVYFSIAFFNFDGGVNVTGSHNVYFYNGFKLMKKNVWPLFGKELQKMREMIEGEDFIYDTRGQYNTKEVFAEYKDYILKHIKLSKPLKIVIDCGNGSAGLFAPEVFRALGCEVIELYTEPDAAFPNHVPDPEQPQNLKDLSETVVKEKADIGIAFDADGDRVGFIDEKGEYVDADLIILFLANDILSRFPGKKILYDVKCSELLQELIPSFGGIPLMHRTGHAPIKERLRKDNDIIFAGEKSGHFFFVEDYFKIDDGIFAAARVIELLSNYQLGFSSIFAGFPKRVRTPEIKLPCSDEEKFGIMEKVKESLGSKYSFTDIDGIRVKVSSTGWGLVRASNTSPYLTIRVEGIDENEVLEVKNILADELEKYPAVGDRLNRSKVAVLEGKLGWV